MGHPVRQHLPQKQIQKTGLSVQAPSSSINDMLKVAIAMQHAMMELSEAVSEDKIMATIRMILNLMKQNGC
jgi:hypothetical protein